MWITRHSPEHGIVAQGMNAVAFFDAGGLSGSVIDPLGGGDAHGAVFVPAEKHVGGRSEAFPVKSHLLQGRGRKQGIAVLCPLAVFHPHQIARAFDMLDPEPDDFADPQARPVGHRQQRPVPDVFAGMDDRQNLLVTEHFGKFALPGTWRNPEIAGFALEEFVEKMVQGGKAHIAGRDNQ